MKKIFYLILLFAHANIYGQITTPVIKANFGVDGDLNANYFNSIVWPGGTDDWFNTNSQLTGIGVIDTTGAAAILARYATDPTSLNTSFSSGGNVTPGSVVNGKLLINSVFVRDYHSPDSTMFANGASKNGMSPGLWNTAVPQSIPNKNDILDVMAHMRRDGTKSTDSLWLFGGTSFESTTGDRYFDFELYQTDIYYNPTTQKFYNYGPDAGHTSWKFDALGDVTQIGDIIFSANYGSSTLTSIEARIWIDSSSMNISPKGFNWSGTFDGGGTQFGYAGIVPKTSGAFYTGLENSSSTWTGAFSLVRANNSVVTNYAPGQFMEFSVNLTKLGLDPYSLLTNVGCGFAIKKLMVKSRASSSFSSQLKDFVAPIDFFKDFKAKITSDASIYCGLVGTSVIKVTNPIQGFYYTWTATNGGQIIGGTTGDSIVVDSPGTYIVTERIQLGCTSYAADTIVVKPFNNACRVLESSLTDFSGILSNNQAELNWSVMQNNEINYFEIENSTDGTHFSSTEKINAIPSGFTITNYKFTDDILAKQSGIIYYRLKIVTVANKVSYSKIIRLLLNENTDQRIKIFPNPVSNNMQITIYSTMAERIKLSIYDADGRLTRTMCANIPEGNSSLNITDFQSWPDGIYLIKIFLGNNLFIKKMILRK